MTTVRLEFELDAEVYPELHAALSTLRNPRARAERMRQLAAAGLVWEKVRLHGSTAAVVAAPTIEERPDVVTRADVSAEPPLQSMPLPALERRASKRSRPSTADKRDDPGFVDLAINAEPTPVPLTRPERHRSRPTRRDVEQVMRELPVLMDVVADGDVEVVPDVRPLSDSQNEPHNEPHDEVHVPAFDEAAHWASMNAYPDDVPPADMTHEHADSTDHDTLDMPVTPLHVTALSRKPATRSRLMKMKERGLFKNG